MMEKDGPETSPSACTQNVQTIYMIKKLVHKLALQSLYGMYRLYTVYDDKSLSQDFP
jgi:hypothetical protein